MAEENRLTSRYFFKSNEADPEAIEPDELAADLGTARMLLENPPSLSALHPWDVPALVAAAALEAYLLHRAVIPADALSFATDTVLRVSEGESSPGPYEFEETYFAKGANRSAARVLPLLLMPAAAHLRAAVDGAGGTATFRRASTAGHKIAQAVASEVRLHLARGLDHLWATPCVQDGPLPSPSWMANHHRDDARLCIRWLDSRIRVAQCHRARRTCLRITYQHCR